MAKGRRNNGDGTLRQRVDGRWEGRVVIGYDENGKAKTKNVLAKTKTECSEKLAKLKEECGRSTDRLKPEMPFGDWIDYWYQNYSKPTLRETTQSTYENRIYHHIIPSIGRIPLNKLTTNDIQQFYAKLKRGGRLRFTDVKGEGLSDRMVRACHASCRMALEKAVTEGLLRVNPAVGCKLPPKKAREMQVLTQPEIMRFLKQAKEEGYYELFLLELTTGMRRGEILGLRWSDLNLTTGELHIQRQVVLTGKQNIISQPKPKASIRTLVLPPDMVEILAELRKTTDSEWIFPSPLDPAKPRNPSAIYNRFQLILERAQCRKVRFHDLRHTFSTMALENGMDVKTLSAMIGHISAETTLNIYSHITDNMRRQAAIRIDRGIGGTDALMPEIEPCKPSCAATDDTVQKEFVPYTGKIRKSGTGCIYQVSERLWEGSFSPRMPDGKRKKFNIYAETCAEVEAKLPELIAQVKADITAEKTRLAEAERGT